MKKLSTNHVIETYNKATEGQDTETWFAMTICNIDKLLMKKPASYRNYGPYWWNLKAILAKNFHNEQECYTDDIEITTADKFDYGNDHLNVIAALLYQNTVRINEFENSEIHGSGEYVIKDDDMEQCAFFGEFPPSYRIQIDDDEEIEGEEAEV